ncbi:MAG TPA: 3TM-type holin [Humidesulfovibrio sp.]|uniref:3TM-type holin n=1 Tax=Humidesulfovibrio sp. TaxID=2910988 RepID=UPI002D17FBD1|nr:3TM-type holin [Humidesulfovibrio sp.]HWR04378.1 3TM-type holin [Humidesulfovibrio sp.]
MGLLDLLPVVGAAAQKLIDLIPDPGARAKAAEEYQRTLLGIAAKAESEQREINKAEAQSASLFVAGWRPAIGWVCACALGFQYLLRPLFAWAGGVWWPQLPPLPGLDSNLWELMFGMLGLGSLRSFEKTKGVAK